MSGLKRHERRAAYLFLLPSFVGFFCFSLLAFLASFVISFFDWDMLTTPSFVGLDNYVNLLHDKTFHLVLWNTFIYTIGTVPLSAGLGLLVALGLNQRIRGLSIYRTIYFMPVVTSLVAVSLLWQWVFDSHYGLLNNMLRFVGVDNAPEWLSSTTWAMPALILMSVWSNIGFTMVLFLAGLQNIPDHLYEAAEIDGASAWQRFRYVTLPLLTPTTFFVLVISTINSFQVFTQALIMTKGGPVHATSTIVYYIYENGFHWFKMGYASAMAWVLFLIIFLLTLLQMRLQRKWVHY